MSIRSRLLRKIRDTFSRLQLSSAQPLENTDYGNSSRPSGSKLSPHIGPVKRPRSQKYKQRIGLLKELKNPLFEVISYLDVGLVEKSRGTASGDLSGDLLGYPRVLAAMADKYEPLI